LPEVSSIKPRIKEAGRPNQEIKFYYSTLEYDSYAKEGFVAPTGRYRPDRKEREFLTRANIERGKIQVAITAMIRLLAPDYSTEKQERREYLLYESDWFAKNWLGAEIPPLRGHVEGRYLEQTKRLVTSTNIETGRVDVVYERGAPRMVHTIPFDKKEVDKVLFGEHPFGPDSINITNLDEVLYYGKFEGIRGISTFRCNDYTYDQFVMPGWEKFLELAIRPGGPANRKPMPDKTRYAT
jgi:hypothetical protein